MSQNQDSNSAGASGKTDFPVIGLGASAGGLRSLKAFFAAVPETGGMAYLVVVHLAPKQRSMMADLLAGAAQISVTTATDGRTIEPDHAYVIPPAQEMTVYKGRIQLMKALNRSPRFPIDILFRSLAHDAGKRAVGVVLSGAGTDGTQGIREIKAVAGLVLAESEDSAEYDGMPRSAAETGLVDMVLPPKQMPGRIASFFAAPKSAAKAKSAPPTTEEQDWLDKIFSVLRMNTRHDFSAYKVNTLHRRINRRMSLNRIESMDIYLRYLRENPNEIQLLLQDLLIGATHFFREPAAFEKLKNDILPAQLKQMKEDETFRAWIPGCSTGEEVYSLSIVLRECLDGVHDRINLQLFGTDIDGRAVQKARQGLYPRGIEADVGEKRLERFFSREGENYRIRKEIREKIIFSVQNLVTDPPFLHLNLLCCRNLLIYLNAEAQQKILPLFHYALNPDGLLMLGASESIGGHTQLFDPLSRKNKIFRKKEVPPLLRRPVEFPSGPPAVENGNETPSSPAPPPAPDLSRLARRAILEQFSPAAVLVDAKGKIQHLQGRSGKYLESPSGPPTQNILELAREGLRIELSSALRLARSTRQPVLRRNITIETDGDIIQTIHLHVRPQSSPKGLDGYFLVAFEDVHPEPGPNPEPDPGEPKASHADAKKNRKTKVLELERELRATRESHQDAIEALESSNENLKSTNEEMQSSNEELQSINEELESSKEELHSLNEELQTVNAELQSKMDELFAAQDDMRNLLNSIEIATIFLDDRMRIRRFTPQATRIVHLIETDIGRPLQHLVTNLTYDGMISDVAEVLRNLAPRNVEVQTREGIWYNMRVIPYRTMDNRIDGAVLAFTRIDEQKKIQERLERTIRKTERARELAHGIFDMNRDPLAALNQEGKIVIGNKSFFSLFKEKPLDLDGIQRRIRTRPDQKPFDLKKELEAEKNFQTESVELETREGWKNCIIGGRMINFGDDIFPGRVLLQFQKPPERRRE